MAKKIRIDVEVNGKMQKAEVSAKKLRKALGGVEQGYHAAGHAAGTFDRRTKGAARATANGTKEFSKMSQGMGGLVGAYATVAASVFALSAAFNFLKNAADLAAQVAGQEMFAARTGTSMKLMTQNIQDATGGLVAFKEAAQAAAIGQAAGLTADQMERLGKVAKNAGTILGRDVTDSFNRLTRGAIKAEPELLDELGIIVRIKDASEEYAKVIGKNASELTTFEKSQAVVNAVLEQGESKFSDVGDSVNEVAAFGAKFRDTFKDMAGPIAEVANFFAGAFKDSILAVSAVFGLLGISILKNIAPIGPVMYSSANAVAAARQRMQAVANTETNSVIAGEIKKGNFTKSVLAAIERAATAKTSTVLNLSKIEVAQVQRDLMVIRLENQKLLADQATGFAKMRAMWKYNLMMMQAEYGKFVGTVKFMLNGLIGAFTKLLSIISFVGIAIMLVELGKQFRQTFLISKDLARAEKSVTALTDTFKKQREEIERVKSTLRDSTSLLNEYAQKFGIVANFNLNPIRENLARIKKEIEEVVDKIPDNTPVFQDRAITDFERRKLEGRGISRTFDTREVAEEYGMPRSAVESTKALASALAFYTAELEKAEEAYARFTEGMGLIEKDRAINSAAGRAVTDLTAKVRFLRNEFFEQDLEMVKPGVGIEEIKKLSEGMVESIRALRENRDALVDANIKIDDLGLDPAKLDAARNRLALLDNEFTLGLVSREDYRKEILAIRDSLLEFTNETDKANMRSAAANASFQSIVNGVKAFGDASDKFMPKDSDFQAVYTGIKDVEGGIKSLVENTNNTLKYASPITKLTERTAEGQDENANAIKKSVQFLLRMRGETEKTTKLNLQNLTLGELQHYLLHEREKFQKAEFILERKATLNKIEQLKIQAGQAEYQRDFNSAAATRQDKELALEQALQRQRNLERLGLKISESQRIEAADAVRLARAELNIAENKLHLEKELKLIKQQQANLAIDNKILSAQRDINSALDKEIRLRAEIRDLNEQRARQGIQTTADEMAAENPFFDKERFIAQQTAELERSLIDQKITAAQEEYAQKVQSIGLEYDLLKAKKLQTIFELEALAKKLEDQGRDEEAEEVLAMASKYDTAITATNARARASALDLAKKQYQTTVESVEESVRGAERTRDALLPINQFLKETGEQFRGSLEEGLGAIFQSTYDKSIDLGEKLKGIGRNFLQDLAERWMKKTLVDPLMKSVGNIFGDLFTEEGPDTKIKDALDTGGDELARKIREALGYTPPGYESPTEIGKLQGQSFVSVLKSQGFTAEAIEAGRMKPGEKDNFAFGTDNSFDALSFDEIPPTPSAAVQSILDAPVQAQSLQESTMATFAPLTPPPMGPTPAGYIQSAPAAGGITASAFTAPMNPLESAATGGAGAGEEGPTSKLDETMSDLGDKVSGLTLETASNITAAGAMIAQLTGNSKAAELLTKATVAMKAYQMVTNALRKVLGIKETTAQGANTAALTANTAALYASSAGGVTGAKGGIYSTGVQEYARGGYAKGPKAGYPAILHGTEAVVPLPDNRSIPVELNGATGNQMNNVVVNVNMETGESEASENNGQQAKQFGGAIAAAVRKEIEIQQRSGGSLNRFGVS